MDATPAETAAAAAPAAGDTRLERFEFRGSGGEYFRIWIVNLALSVVTLGIYSAWAKVRRLKYFYGNTVLAGSAFGYHADPLKILKGRLIALGFFVIYGVSGEISPILGLVAGALLFIGIPWIVVRSRMFALRMSSFRNIRFGFRRDYRGAVGVFIGFALLVGLTLGLLFPAWQKRRWEFLVDRSRFGQTPFTASFRTGSFYGAYSKATLVAIAGLALVAAPLAALLGSGVFTLPELGGAPGEAGKPPDPVVLMIVVGAAYAVFLPVLLAASAFLRSRMLNIVYGNTALGPHQVRSSLRFRGLFWLYLSNLVMIVVTSGLFIPWARVRMARYRAQCTALEVHGSLDDFIAGEEQAGSAAGEEIGEFFDVDLGL